MTCGDWLVVAAIALCLLVSVRNSIGANRARERLIRMQAAYEAEIARLKAGHRVDQREENE
jgi:hypothetical protein